MTTNERILILIVDDEPDIRMVITNALTSGGYEVIEAASGAEALALLRGRPDIDLLFTDIVMPSGIDGFELAHRAKQLRPELRVIYTSGFIRTLPWGEYGVGYGPMLAKPFRNASLLAEVKRAFAAPGPQ